MKDDTISRAAALDAIGEQPLVWTDDDDFAQGKATQWEYDIDAIKALPSAQLYALDEWCTDCSEYDAERHCCPRYNRVIRDALKMQRGKNMRLIDADALLDRIRNPYEQAQVARWVNEQPTINQWIPCSEETGDGYPEEDGLYYVTEQNYGFYLDADYKQRIAHTSHFKNGDFTDRFFLENNSNITAWMPLPAPYKGADA